jgi:hypothetical protein
MPRLLQYYHAALVANNVWCVPPSPPAEDQIASLMTLLTFDNGDDDE